jgi:hypothetical protein
LIVYEALVLYLVIIMLSCHFENKSNLFSDLASSKVAKVHASLIKTTSFCANFKLHLSLCLSVCLSLCSFFLQSLTATFTKVGNTTKRLTNKTIFAQIQFSFYFVALTFETFACCFCCQVEIGETVCRSFLLSKLST